MITGWLQTRRLDAWMRGIDHYATLLVLFSIGLYALTPFSTAVLATALGSNDDLGTAVRLSSGLLFVALVVFALMLLYARNAGLLRDDVDADARTLYLRSAMMVPVVPVVAFLLSYDFPWVGLVLLVGLNVLGLLPLEAHRPWSLRVDRELPDLRAAVAESVAADDAESAVRLTAPLFSYWWSSGRLAPMRATAEQVAALPSAAALPADAAALLLWARGMFRISAGDLTGAEPYLRRLLAAATELADPQLRAHALTGLGLVTAGTDPAAAMASLDEAVGIFRGAGDAWGSAFALSSRGQLALQAGDPAGAVAAHTEALAAAERLNNDHLRAQVLDLLGLDALATGDLTGARDRFAAAAEVHRRLLDLEGSAYCLDGFAGVAIAQGRAGVAATLLGASAHAREVVGVAVWPGMVPLAEAMTAAVAAAAGEPVYGVARAAGAAMRTADALAYGLSATA